MHLIRPSLSHLASYAAALERGWSPDNTRPVAAAEELEWLRADGPSFLASLEDREGTGPPVTMPDGSFVPRLPGIRRWMWDGEFAGSIGFRWQPGTTSLPPYCLGHIGYAVVPWKEGRGYAKNALRLILPEARALKMPFVELTTDPENVASQRVIESVGGVLHEEFTKPLQHGARRGWRFRIYL
ncbi:MAG: GNAT family N-acetyltransferase [Gemmatimonadaceae bacterium]|nr:GNAT family N-acetyltransferase [Gemmatimonadaceae bacterium]